MLFDKSWKQRHRTGVTRIEARSGRNGENDYAKTAITEPLAACLEALEGLRCKAEQAKRFILRSVVGASLGLALHSLATRLWGKSEKAD